MRALTLALAAALLAGPGCDRPSPAGPVENVLARRLRVDASGFAAVHAEWTEDGVPRSSRSVAVPPDGQAVVDVLGLLPDHAYAVTPVLEGEPGTRRLAPVRFRTPPLPPEVADLSLDVTGAPPDGYLLLNVAGRTPGTLAAFDGQGRLRWYHVFDAALPLAEAKQLPSGNYLGYLGTSTGAAPVDGRYVEITPAGEVLRSFTAAAPYTDPHEALLTGEGTAEERVHLFGYEARLVELAPLGLAGLGAVVGHRLERLRPDGSAEFTWSAFDHVGLEELVNPSAAGSPVGQDYDHPNSLELDADGNYLVSWRNLDAIFLVDRNTGEVRWRLGGTRSDFTFVDDPLGGFSGQHDARLLPGGHLLVFDNGTLHAPRTTRVAEYALDTGAWTATLVWEWRAGEDRWNAFMGSARRDAEGTTWVGLSMLGIIDRVAADGTVRWEGRLRTREGGGRFYRAIPIAGL